MISNKFRILAIVSVMLVASCATPVSSTSSGVQQETITVEISFKDFGKVEAELYPDIAPITVANFVDLVNQKFYDGLTIHRIIPGFVIQGGDPKGDGTGGSPSTIKGEFLANGFANPLKHEPGVLSMARSSLYNSASSQFFIVHEQASNLNDFYAAFGKVTVGFSIIDLITQVETGANDRPLEPVIIEYIRIKK
jgi:peptidyl-prolyl cis-trans isomerase B (cyclophilin B)